MDFSKALNMCKAGKSIRRTGWNGKDQYVYYVKAGKYSPASKIAQVAFRGQDVPYRDYLAMKTVQNDVVPWIASQSDLLCDDWEEYFSKVPEPVKIQLPISVDLWFFRNMTNAIPKTPEPKPEEMSTKEFESWFMHQLFGKHNCYLNHQDDKNLL